MVLAGPPAWVTPATLRAAALRRLVFRANQAYDPNSNSWAEKASMPTPRHGFAKGVIDGKLYAVSGVTTASSMFSIVAVNEVYTP